MNKQKYKAILAVDFDDTVVDSKYPRIIGLKKDADYYINKLHDEGFYIIINTCRTGIYQDDVEKFLQSQGVKYHQINSNHKALIDYFKEDSRKISADVYIDDKNIELLFNPGTNWEKYYSMIHSILKDKNFCSVLSLVNLAI